LGHNIERSISTKAGITSEVKKNEASSGCTVLVTANQRKAFAKRFVVGMRAWFYKIAAAKHMLGQARDLVDNYATTTMTSWYLGLTSTSLTNGSGGSKHQYM